MTTPENARHRTPLLARFAAGLPLVAVVAGCGGGATLTREQVERSVGAQVTRVLRPAGHFTSKVTCAEADRPRTFQCQVSVGTGKGKYAMTLPPRDVTATVSKDARSVVVDDLSEFQR